MSNKKNKPLGRSNKKVIEKVEYKGEYRIIGTVWAEKTQVGYAVMDVKTHQLRLFTTVQTFELLRRYKFENAVIEREKIHNTECSMDRLLKFDTKQNVIGNRGITILGEIFTSPTISAGYRAMDATGKVVDLQEKQLISIIKQSEQGLLNAKLVSGPTGEFVSAIKGNFKKVAKVAVEEQKDEEYVKALEKEKHENYLLKLTGKYTHSIISKGYIRPFTSKTSKKNAKIFLREFVKHKYPMLLKHMDVSAETVVTAAVLLNLVEKGSFSYREYARFESNTAKSQTQKSNRLVFVERGYIVERAEPTPREILADVAYIDKTGEVYDFLNLRNEVLLGNKRTIAPEENNIRHPQLKKVIASYINTHVRKRKPRKERPIYSTGSIPYTETSGIAEFGYTIDKSEVGQLHNSKIYGEKPLRYFFDGLNLSQTDEDFLLEAINCYGDVEILRNIKKLQSLERNDGYIEQYIQTCLFVLSMHNPEIANFAATHFSINPVFDIDKISRENFFLGREDHLYYHSGMRFGVFKKLRQFDSWNDLNRIPTATRQAIGMHVNAVLGGEPPYQTPALNARRTY